MPESDERSKPRDWKEIEDEVRSAWKAEPESQPVRSNLLLGKEVHLPSKARRWLVRSAIGVLTLIIVVGAIALALAGSPTSSVQPTVQLAGGPPMRLLPTPPVEGAPVRLPEPTVRPEDYLVYPTPPASVTPAP